MTFSDLPGWSAVLELDLEQFHRENIATIIQRRNFPKQLTKLSNFIVTFSTIISTGCPRKVITKMFVIDELKL